MIVQAVTPNRLVPLLVAAMGQASATTTPPVVTVDHITVASLL